MKTVPQTIILAFSLFLLLPTCAWAYYSPEQGRWISRDPSVEEAFKTSPGGRAEVPSTRAATDAHIEDDHMGATDEANPVRFIGNLPTGFIDYLGLFVRTGNYIRVAKCEIVVVYGHGSRSGGWRWHMGKSGCNAGSAIMCWPSANSSGLEPNLLEGWGEVNENGVWEPLTTVNPFNSQTDWPRNSKNNINLNAIMEMAITNAVKKSIELCNSQQCCCKEVSVRFIRVLPGPTVTEDPGPRTRHPKDKFVPNWPSFSKDCKTRKLTFDPKWL